MPEIKPALEDMSPATMRAHKNGKTKPKSVQALEALKDIGITFPITRTSKHFQNIFILGVNSLFSGSLTPKYNPHIHKYPRLTLEESEAMLEEKTSFKFKTYPMNDAMRLDIGKKEAPAIGRMIHLLFERVPDMM